MKKGDICEGVVQEIRFPNKGIVATEEGTVSVKNVIPGQKVRCRILKKKKGSYEGQLVEVTETSPLQTEDQICSMFPACGGCVYRTLHYAEQLKIKESQVRSMLDEVLEECGQTDDAGRPDYVFEGIHGSPDENRFRNKMEYSFGDEVKGGPLTLGLHKKNSMFDVLAACDCAIVHEDFNRIVRCVLEYCRERGWDYYHKNTHTGYLRHLLVRRARATGEILIDLVTSSA